MATRGAISFCINDELRTFYNHWDSYPTSLGNDILDFIRRYPLNSILDGVGKLVDTNYESSFYEFDDFLATGAKGEFPYKDETSFLLDSLFCEWAYIINLDNNKLELYKSPKNDLIIGRFKNMVKDNIKPVTLVTEFNFDELPYKFTSNNYDTT